MHATCLTVTQRERFNELANIDLSLQAEKIRSQFNQEQWLSNEDEIFWITTEQKDYLLSVWDQITN